MVATGVRTPDRDPSAGTLARRLAQVHGQHDAYVTRLVDEVATGALENDICSQFEAYLDEQGLEIPTRSWTVTVRLDVDIEVEAPFREDSSDVCDLVTDEQVAAALGIDVHQLAQVDWEAVSAERY